jgi:hypothetical protein
MHRGHKPSNLKTMAAVNSNNFVSHAACVGAIGSSKVLRLNGNFPIVLVIPLKVEGKTFGAMEMPQKVL